MITQENDKITDESPSGVQVIKPDISINIPNEAEGEAEDEYESDDEEQFNPETSANVSSAIMLKVPTSSLSSIRENFESQTNGLNLTQFLKAFVENMTLDSDEALLKIVPDLVDFFNLVDINGDKRMDWSEFVMFVIEQVVKDDYNVIHEKLTHVDQHPLQMAHTHFMVKCSKYIPELNKIAVGVGGELQIYDTEELSPTWLSSPVRIKLRKKQHKSELMQSAQENEKQQQIRDRINPKLGNLQVLDLQYIPSADILVIMRNDICFEFVKFSSRTKTSPEFILHFGVVDMGMLFTKIAIKDIPKEPVTLFALSASEVIDIWELEIGKIGPVNFKNHRQIKYHKDYVCDVMTIHNDLYNVFVTGGLDKLVHIWDLSTFQHCTTRSGMTAGVQCLAFDNRSLLFAGGFDFQILAWDLDAEIDRPIFTLIGHCSPVLKMVPLGSSDRCLSLDVRGDFVLWDIGKFSTADREERQIDIIKTTEDHARCFDVLPRSGSQFSTVHGIILVAQGRNQHVYKLADTSVLESAPLNVLYSIPLMMVITVHTKDVIFWNIITGDEQSKMSNFMNTADILVATMDDRNRKLLVGDSAGILRIFNCLNGAVLKTFPSLQCAIRFIIFSPDKTIIVVAGSGDLYIYDDHTNEEYAADALLRESHAHEADIISIAYSYSLGLIATIDCKGMLIVWDYQYLSIEIILKDFLHPSDLAQVTFLEPFPLLLVADSTNNFFIVPVGKAAAHYGRVLWSVTSKVQLLNKTASRMSFMQSLDNMNSAAASPHRGRGLTFGGSSSNLLGSGARTPLARQPSGEIKDLPSSPVRGGLLRQSTGLMAEALQSPGTAGATPGGPMTGDTKKRPLTRMNSAEALDENYDEEVQKIDGARKPWSKRKMQSYLQQRNDVKCLVTHPIFYKKDGTIQMSSSFDDLFAKSFEVGGVASETSITPILALSNDADSQCTIHNGYPQNVRYYVFAGKEDGSIGIFDFTAALREIDYPILRETDHAYKQPGYDARKVANFKFLRDIDLQRSAYSAAELEQKQHLSCILKNAYYAHKTSIPSMKVFHDQDGSDDILTCGEDGCVNLYNLWTGTLKGILTRGREVDKLFRPRWRNPIDMKRRERTRRREAIRLVHELALHRSNKVQAEVHDPFSDGQKPVKKATDESMAAAIKKGLNLADVKAQKVPPTEGRNTMKKLLNEAIAKGRAEQQDDNHSVMSRQSTARSLRSLRSNAEPDHLRVLGQLQGKVTYEMSHREMAKEQLEIREQQLLMHTSQIEHRKKKKKKLQYLFQTSKKANSGCDYLNELMDTKGFHNKESLIETKHVPKEISKSSSTRKVKSVFDVEIEKLEINDPSNWEISSRNRQRAFYGKLYYEMDRYHGTKDAMKILNVKLNTLSPTGNFAEYAQEIRAMRRRTRDRLNSQSIGLSRDDFDLNTTFGSMISPDGDMAAAQSPKPTSEPLLQQQGVPEKKPAIFARPRSPPSSAPPGMERSLPTIQEVVQVPKLETTKITAPVVEDQPLAHSASKKSSKFKVPGASAFKNQDVYLHEVVNKFRDDEEKRGEAQFNICGKEGVMFSSAADAKHAALQHSLIQEHWVNFEAELKEAEAIYRKARRKVRQNKRRLSKHENSGKILLEPMDKQKMMRHTTSKLLITRQYSFNGLMQLGLKKREVERTIERKMMFTLGALSTAMDRRDSLSQESQMIKKPAGGEEEQTAGGTVSDSQVSSQEGSRSKAGSPSKMEGNTRVRRRRKTRSQSMSDSTHSASESEHGHKELDTFSLSLSVGTGGSTVNAGMEDTTSINLMKLLKHKMIRSKPHFQIEVMKLIDLKHKQSGVPKIEITAALTEVLSSLRPYMSDAERKNSKMFLKESMEKERRKAKLRKDTISVNEIEVLRSLFDFFDKDRSGYIDHTELLGVLHATLDNSKKEVNDMQSNENAAAYNALDEMGIKRMIQSVDSDGNDQLDFEEFVKLFKNTLYDM